jgi:hypothetical protein
MPKYLLAYHGGGMNDSGGSGEVGETIDVM